jgi:diguanylate cyclase (GGDEF)-like protein
MGNWLEEPTRLNVLRPAALLVRQSYWEIRGVRRLLLAVMLAEAISVLVPGISNHWRNEFWFLPQLLIGFVVLALIFTLHLASQRKLLLEVSKALIVASSDVYKLEQYSFVDPQTELFKRGYLDHLFNRQLKWLIRSGKSATLLMLEVLPKGPKAATEEIVSKAASFLQSNFRGSDYVVRYRTDRFLVVLPDTTEQQAQYALDRLASKVDSWNLENRTREMSLRHELSTCPPGVNLWEKLHEIEERIAA